MGSVWIEYETLRPRIDRFARHMKVDGREVFGHLLLLWYWALDHAPDGDASAWQWSDILEAADWDSSDSEPVWALVVAGLADFVDDCAGIRLRVGPEHGIEFRANK